MEIVSDPPCYQAAINLLFLAFPLKEMVLQTIQKWNLRKGMQAVAVIESKERIMLLGIINGYGRSKHNVLDLCPFTLCKCHTV